MIEMKSPYPLYCNGYRLIFSALGEKVKIYIIKHELIIGVLPLMGISQKRIEVLFWLFLLGLNIIREVVLIFKFAK